MTEIPMGLVGVHPRMPIGVHVNMSIRGDNGSPTMGGRFWMMAQPTISRKFSTPEKSWSSLSRDEHPRFAAWNAEARRLGKEFDPRKGAGRVAVLRGNIVHARWEDAASWNRSAQKLPTPHPNPSLSRRPACEGNGIRARRFVRNHGDEEVFDSIACPNQLCPFAQAGACKPDTSLIFKLRWNEADPWEAQFPALLAHWHTGGWESTAALMGLFEYVLGTEALLSPEDRSQTTEEERASWRPGFAAALGLSAADISLVGMPFTMSVHYRTKAGDSRNPAGSRFPVVSFSPEGDLEAWLVAQHQRRTLLAGAPEPLALPAASVREPGFIETTRHEARLETSGAVLGEVVDVVGEALPMPAEPAVELDSRALLEEIGAVLTQRCGDDGERRGEALHAAFGLERREVAKLPADRLASGLAVLREYLARPVEELPEPEPSPPALLSWERRKRLTELAEAKFGPEGAVVLAGMVERLVGTSDLAQCPAAHDTAILRALKDEEIRRLKASPADSGAARRPRKA